MNTEKALAEADRAIFKAGAMATANKAVLALMLQGLPVTTGNAAQMYGQWADAADPLVEAFFLEVNDNVEDIINAGAKMGVYDV